MDIDITSLSQDMPDFHNHEEAREWFKNQFHERFSLRSSDDEDGKKVYYYHLIKHPDQYEQYMESFAKEQEGHEITNMETFESYSTVQITEDGDIHFIS
ncbi:hypothetical protein [Texcoconibacillus texcoconensis]|uniref:Uncharacterized protein n=1 Tax=Texcoconibacillus texcoconensis TaxID=1095777 RepID=A0A840QMC9_9BACI|nr:hypothetical protein [Texcoconibacillus texcoconensis]MBB5172491.1 hypothetical protein [Texcoconibacillus texcoconensis]